MATRKEPRPSVIKALFAKSGNICAFPSCFQPLIDDRNLFVGQVCHIYAVSKSDARFDPQKCADELRSFENLILLCYPHHKRIDRFEDEFTAAILKSMKSIHEAKFERSEFEAPESAVDEATIQIMDSNWAPPLDQVIDQIQEVLDTGIAMSYSAANMCYVLDAKLFFVYTELFQSLPPSEQVSLYYEHLAWRERRAEISGKSRGEGSQGTLDVCLTYIFTTEARIEELDSRIKTPNTRAAAGAHPSL